MHRSCLISLFPSCKFTLFVVVWFAYSTIAALTPLHSTASSSAAPMRGPVDPSLVFRFRILRTYPSDAEAFVQGLTFDNGTLLMSTGLWGRSAIRKVDYSTGRILQRHDLSPDIFAEGIAVLGDHLFQLTYQNNVAYVYDKATFERIATLNYPSDLYEGWGLAADSKRNILFISDGSEHIRIANTQFRVLSQIRVHDSAGRAVTGINELEFVSGELLANVYGSDCVLRISPVSGEVLGWIVAENLYPDNPDQGLNVFNGLAFDETTGKLLVSGLLLFLRKVISRMNEKCCVCVCMYVSGHRQNVAPRVRSHDGTSERPTGLFGNV